MEFVEIYCDKNLYVFLTIPYVLFTLGTFIYMLKIRPLPLLSIPFFSIMGINILFIISIYIILPHYIEQKTEKEAIKKILPVWNKWIENKEIINSPIISHEINGNFLKIQIATGDIYYIPYIHQKNKRILIFEYYKCLRQI